MIPLPPEFLTRPLAHRGLHGLAPGAPENSVAAFQRAVEQGYGIELDVQLSRDGQAMVIHDENLDRLTGETGPVRSRSARELGEIHLNGGGGGIPTLAEVLMLVDRRVPVLIEIKDQDGQLGANTGTLEAATARALQDAKGPVAVMSFNPHAVAAVKGVDPSIPLGLVTDPFRPEDWDGVPHQRLAELRPIDDAVRLDVGFISHDRSDLGSEAVAAIKAAGLPVLCWTVRSPAEEKTARKIADNITFEGYLA